MPFTIGKTLRFEAARELFGGLRLDARYPDELGALRRVNGGKPLQPLDRPVPGLQFGAVLAGLVQGGEHVLGLATLEGLSSGYLDQLLLLPELLEFQFRCPQLLPQPQGALRKPGVGLLEGLQPGGLLSELELKPADSNN